VTTQDAGASGGWPGTRSPCGLAPLRRHRLAETVAADGVRPPALYRADVERLQKIVCLRDLGLSLLDIGVCWIAIMPRCRLYSKHTKPRWASGRGSAAPASTLAGSNCGAASWRSDSRGAYHPEIEEMTTMFHKYYTPNR